MSHESTVAIVVGSIAAGATITATSIAALTAYLASKRERRRKLYGEAYQVGMGWIEMLYRVRRRTNDNQGDIVTQFHALQEKIQFYQGWIGSESRYMMRSYGRLVRAVKTTTEPLITEAWRDAIRPVPGNALPADDHPNLDSHADEFLCDVRSYLSPWQIRKFAVMWRNRKSRNGS